MESRDIILFIGSLLPTKKNPEGGIFFYKLIYFLNKQVKGSYVFYPKKFKFPIKDELIKELINITRVSYRPLFLSFGNLRFLKFIYIFLNYFSFLTFYYAIKRSYKRLIKEKHPKPNFIYSHFIFPAGLSAGILSRKENILSIVAVGESSLDYLEFLPKDFVIRNLKKITIFISVNSKNSQILKEKYGVDKSKIYVIPNAADSKIFFKKDTQICRNKLNLDQKQKYILFVGTLTKRKGIDTLLQVAKKNPSYKFILIGRDPENFGSKINKFKNIFYEGVKTQEIISDYMNACDLFILYSKNEGSPNVLLEANATRLPILCSNINEHRELFGKHGAFYSNAIYNNIPDDLNKIFSSEKYKKLRHYSNQFPQKSFANRVENIYKIINEHLKTNNHNRI